MHFSPVFATTSRWESQAVQFRFCKSANSHLRGCASPLAFTDSLAPSADEPSDFIGLSSVQRDSLQHYALCTRPLSPLLHTLAGHSYGVDLGRFPRGLSTLLRRPLERSYSVQSGISGRSCGWVLSPTLCTANFGQYSNKKSSLVLTLLRPPACALAGAELRLKSPISIDLCWRTPTWRSLH